MDINEADMSFRVADVTIAKAWRDGATWTVAVSGRVLYTDVTRDQAITALTIVECVAADMPDDHPLVLSLRSELP